MSLLAFFDTNVLVYAFASGDPRSVRAEELMSEGGVVGVQVLNEFVAVSRRKLGREWDEIEAALAVTEELLGVARPLTAGIHAQALKLARTQQLGFYDALIVAAAQDAGCRRLLTEDLQHGRTFGALRVHNPFLE